ncbi:MAG: hypothetical protein SH807_04850 [Blastochloris sp.]|nr:hypothetical protein [Blastochloris sp.]
MILSEKINQFFGRFALILKQRRTRRVLLLFAALFFVLGAGLLYLLRPTNLSNALAWLGQKSGQRVEIGQATFKNYHTLELRNVTIGDFARLDFLELQWTYRGLLSRELEQIRIHGVQLFLSKLENSAEKKQNKKDKKSSNPFKVKKAILGQGIIFLDNLGSGLPPLPLRIAEVTPLVLNNLKLGGSETDPTADELQIVILDDLKFYSPYDAFSPVIGFEQVRLAFSWNGIQNQLLDQLVLTNPTIYVSDDLFLFVDQVQAQRAKLVKKEITKPWSISSFEVKNGQIVVTTFSQPGTTLPFLFSSKPQSIVLDDFSKIQFATDFIIEKTNLSYPDYGLKIQGMEGKLSFSLPLSEKNVANLVPVLSLESVEWKGLKMIEAWVGLTFDRRGIFGEFGGKTYQGYTQGTVAIYLKDGFPWVASAVVSKVDVEPITRLLSPENFLLNGPVSLSFKVSGKSKQVLDLNGVATLDGPGVMSIPAIDEVLAKLPGEWSLTKKDLSEIALMAFKRYDYSTGHCEINFAPPTSTFQLRLDGKQGQRNIDLKWNDERPQPGLIF